MKHRHIWLFVCSPTASDILVMHELERVRKTCNISYYGSHLTASRCVMVFRITQRYSIRSNRGVMVGSICCSEEESASGRPRLSRLESWRRCIGGGTRLLAVGRAWRCNARLLWKLALLWHRDSEWATPHFEAKEDAVYSRGRSTTHARGTVRVVELQAGCSEGYVCRPRRRLSSGAQRHMLADPDHGSIHEIQVASNFPQQPGRKKFLTHRAHGRSALGERAGSAILLVLVQRSARVDPDDGQGRGQILQTARCSAWPLGGGGRSRREGERVYSGGCNWPGRVRPTGASLADCTLLIRSDDLHAIASRAAIHVECSTSVVDFSSRTADGGLAGQLV